jgi:putative endonuclease
MWVYLLECLDGSIYTGITNNLERRFRQHATGIGANYTKKHGARRLIYTEPHSTRGDALKREREIKTWDHESKINLANGTLISPSIYHRKFFRKKRPTGFSLSYLFSGSC